MRGEMTDQDIASVSSVAEAAERTLEQIGRAREAVSSVIFGQDEAIEEALVTLLAGGHGLLVGVPGLA